ncbi:nucleoside-diphosphate kinase [Rhizobium leguminosarum]|uniref:nucleoside-diphosphate kinase n=1 Tax=Rhizobium leguminosarum TaxID=384 RepID=UPI001C984022|nr:nucleoside-diphosphate kinase [Rhizobium leguminosarum]MBY5336076.1 nucleoside-diphosphate kinase [Rhizobium leguminosarum]
MSTEIQRTFLLLKPDAILRALIGVILNEFEQKGFRISAMRMLFLNDELLYGLYPFLPERAFHDQVKSSMQCAPCVAFVLEGRNAIKRAFELAGPEKKSEENPAYTIRGKYSMWTGADVIHRAATYEEAETQISMFFGSDICEYQRLDGMFLSETGWRQRA